MNINEKKVLVSTEGMIIIGNVIIYDPYFYSTDDITKLEDYKTVRVRRPHWGSFNKKSD